MDATAELPQAYQSPTAELKRMCRSDYIAGKGYTPAIAERYNLSPNTVKRWMIEGEWTTLRERREQAELAKLEQGLLPEEPLPSKPMDEIGILEQHLKDTDAMLKECEDAKDRAQLARARKEFAEQLWLARHGARPPQGKLGAKPRKTPLAEIMPIPSPLDPPANDPNEPNG